jgi:3-deoxy-D-manno-octulosonic-acid transferase
MTSEFLITYGEGFIGKPNSLYDFLIVGKISDQLSHPKFFKKYDPKVIICLDGPLPFLLTSRIKRKKYLSIFADARLANLAKRKIRILSTFKKNVFNQFDFIFTENEMAASQLFQNSVDERKIKGMGLLQSSIAPLPFSENNSVFSMLKGRPIWAALNIHEREIDFVLKAHRQALQAAFQYCLTISLSNPKTEYVLKEYCSKLDLRLSTVEDIQTSGEATQVYLSKEPVNNIQLMRLAPVVFHGNTLAMLDQQEDPLVAASLCCGILHGPNTSVYSMEYEGLKSVGAALQVQSSSELATELNKLYSADKAANMGIAALDFISSGAENTDKIVELVFEYLKDRELI